jgi:putative ABC transport system ATP-binding protein
MEILDIKNVTKTYGAGRTAVKAVNNVSLKIKSGEVVLIQGPSGSGKTTLLSMAGGLLKPTSGKIKIKNREITALYEREMPDIRLEHIGFVFQAFNLLSALTAQENVAVVFNIAGVKGDEANEKSIDILAKLGLEKRLNHKPAELSGGEQQRVAIGRALALDPDIILADEPTGNLDSKTGHEVISLLCKIACNQGKSVLIASHDERIKDIADRIILLEDGRIKREEKVELKHRDPVCGMKISKADYVLEYRGKTYYFCSKDCKKKFQKKI